LSRYKMNPLNESFSMNVFRMRGMAYKPDKQKYMCAEKVMLRPALVCTV
jgi:hypothetical protein